MRITPTGNIGIGDFSTAALAQQPTEKIDIDGGARIRQLPSNDTPDVIITGSEVDAVGDYLLTYSTINDLAGIDCRWKDIPSSTISGGTTEDLFTGYDPGSDCYRDKVAVGLKGPQQAKLEVYMLNDELNAFNNPIRNDNVLVGTYSRASTTREENDFVVGVSGVSDCLGNTGVSNAANIGVNGLGADARYAVGVRGEGRATPATGTFVAIGVRGEAGEVGPAGFNIGVYGEVPTGYSGYFVGGLHVTSGTSVPISDESVKTDVSEITNASEILSQLQPKTYYFQSPENREIGFEEGLQYGLIAQEVQEVIPDIVETIKLPAKFDSSGTYDPSTEIELLGIQYGQLIPLIVSAYNEQSTQVAEQAQIISDQEETIEELENQLADLSASLGQLQESVAQLNAVVEQNQAKSNDCCERISNLMGDAEKLGKQSSLEQNVPNPFQDVTQIDYNLATNGTVRMIITNELGQPIETLVNGEMSSGQHSVRWNASNQAPGVYYYTLYFNGDLMTKKMIKL